jgi:hypothetical protein
MYFIYLLAALAVAGIGVLVRRRSAGMGNALMLAGCLGCVAAVGWLVRSTLFTPGFEVPSRAHSVVGFFLASQTQAAIAGKKGTVVLVMPRAFKADTAESYANTFRGPFLRGHPEWEAEVATVDLRKVNNPGTIPPEIFRQVTEKFPNAIAYVSFAGAPSGLETIFPPNAIPPVFVFDQSGTTNWFGELVQHRIRSVIVPRRDIDPKMMESVAGMPGEVFPQLYHLATPENAREIAARLATR